MFRPRRPLPCPALPAEHVGPSPSSFANLQTFQHSNFLTLPQSIPFRIRTYEKHAPNPFIIRTCKTQDLKPFRMNTYKKTGEGVPCRVTSPTQRPYSPARDDKPAIRPSFRSRTETLDPVRNHWYIACHTEGLTSKEFATPRPYRRDHTEVPNSSVSPTHQITKASQP